MEQNINWRKENKIDTILTEDWSDFERDFRADIQGCDLEGRPVISVPVWVTIYNNSYLSV